MDQILIGIIGGGFAILGVIATKVLDYWLAEVNERRDFGRHRREKALAEIEELKNQLGVIYELSTNWNAYEAKLGDYGAFFAKDYEMIGRCNKYPDIARAARDTVYWCKIVAFGEREQRDDLIQNKGELSKKYQAFIQACDTHIDSMI